MNKIAPCFIFLILLVVVLSSASSNTTNDKTFSNQYMSFQYLDTYNATEMDGGKFVEIKDPSDNIHAWYKFTLLNRSIEEEGASIISSEGEGLKKIRRREMHV